MGAVNHEEQENEHARVPGRAKPRGSFDGSARCRTKAAIETGKRVTAGGKPARYIRSTFVPADARGMCLFETPQADYVKELNDTAKLLYTKIVEAMDLTP